jgi:tetratricopeptide (TPR) repeat protein
MLVATGEMTNRKIIVLVLVSVLIASTLMWNLNLVFNGIWGPFAMIVLSISLLLCLPVIITVVAILSGKIGRLYSFASILLVSVYGVLRLPLYRWLFGLRAYSAVELTELALLQDDMPKVREWADKALELTKATEDDEVYSSELKANTMWCNWHGAFRAMSNAGAACFALGQNDLAESYLRKAWDLWMSKGDVTDFASVYQAANLDVLAHIRLLAGDLGQAQQLFDRSSSLRTDTEFHWGKSSSAYVKNVRGTMDLARNNLVEAESAILAAASDLQTVPNYRLPADVDVAVSVLCNLKRLTSDDSKESYARLHRLYKQYFHSVHIRRLK